MFGGFGVGGLFSMWLIRERERDGCNSLTRSVVASELGSPATRVGARERIR